MKPDPYKTLAITSIGFDLLGISSRLGVVYGPPDASTVIGWLLLLRPMAFHILSTGPHLRLGAG